VIIGGGPAGTQMAGALADMINLTMPAEFADLAVKHAGDCIQSFFGRNRHHGLRRRYQDRKRNLFDSVRTKDAPRSQLAPEDAVRAGNEW
jgi:hypothetical protein